MDCDKPSGHPKPPAPLDGFMRRVEVCNKLGITSRTLSRWISKGKFPPPLKVDEGSMWERWMVEQLGEWRQKLIEELRDRKVDP